jgi:hypothetical protein
LAIRDQRAVVSAIGYAVVVVVGVAGVPRPVPVGIVLPGVRVERAVIQRIVYTIAVEIGITCVADAIAVQVALPGVGLDRTIVRCIHHAVVIVVRIAGIALAVAVAVRLVRVGGQRAVVADVENPIVVVVRVADIALQVQASFHLGKAYSAIGKFGRAAELLRRNVEVAHREFGTPSIDMLIQSQGELARTLSTLGAFAEGRCHGEEALRLATLKGRGVTPVIIQSNLGDLNLTQGDLAQAIRVYEQGLALSRACGNQNRLRMIPAALGYACALQGRLAEGRALLEEAISEGTRMGALESQSLRVARLSEVCRLAGRGAKAWQHARQALDLARQLKERGSEAHALHQLGVVHAHAAPPMPSRPKPTTSRR